MIENKTRPPLPAPIQILIARNVTYAASSSVILRTVHGWNVGDILCVLLVVWLFFGLVYDVRHAWRHYRWREDE